MISARDSGGLSGIGAIRVRDASNVLVDLAQMSIRDGTGLYPLLVSFSVLASPDYNYGFGSSGVPIQVVTNPCGVTVTGGSPPYTYLWVMDDPTWEAVTPTSPSTLFRSPLLNSGDSSATTATCEVTDSNTNTVVSNTVTAEATNTGFP